MKIDLLKNWGKSAADAMRGLLLFLLVLSGIPAFPSLHAADAPAVKKPDTRITLPYVAWDAYMLGIDTPEKVRELRASRKRVPTVGLVSFSGLTRERHKKFLGDGREIEYAFGKPAGPKSMHDNYQISEVLQIAAHLGVAMRIRVYHVADAKQFAAALARAGKESEIVITYHSVWRSVKPLAEAIAANPGTLYIAPYAEIAGRPPTGNSLQSRARHPDGTGLRNFITTIPLARNAKGSLMVPSCRNAKDSETINVVAPSSYASGRGETCPSVGVTTVVAAYIVSAAPEKLSAEAIIRLMLDNVSVPETRMLSLVNYNRTSVRTLRDRLRDLTSVDAVGIRRLEADGVLDLWKIHRAMHAPPHRR